MARFYVSSGGADSAPGTVDAPWRTIAKVNAGLAAEVIVPGDEVLFKAGDTFYGGVRGKLWSGAAGQIRFGAYGEGARPIIAGWKSPYGSRWVAAGAGKWKVNLNAGSGDFGGALDETVSDVGFLLIDGVIWAGRKATSVEVAQKWDFHCAEDGTLTVRSPEKPASGQILAASAASGFTMSGSFLIDGLEITGFGAHGVRNGTGANFRVTRCKIHKIGGGMLADGRRFGNGVEAWVTSSEGRIDHNEISDVYDVAITYQGGAGSTAQGFVNLGADHNTITNCMQSFEVWATGSSTVGMQGCSFVDNFCAAAGEVAFSKWRPDNNDKGVHILGYSITVPIDLTIERNVFLGARDGWFRRLGNGVEGDILPGWKSNNNIVGLVEGQRIDLVRPQTIIDHAAWVADTGLDRDSKFFSMPASVATLDDAVSLSAAHVVSATSLGISAHSSGGGDPSRQECVGAAMVKGSWYTSGHVTFGSSAEGATVRLFPIEIGRTARISQFAYTNVTAGSVSSVRMALYRGNPVSGLSKIVESTGSDMSVGMKIAGLPSPAMVMAGETIWVGVVLSGSNPPAVATGTSHDPRLPANGGSSVCAGYAVASVTLPDRIDASALSPASSAFRVAIRAT